MALPDFQVLMFNALRLSTAGLEVAAAQRCIEEPGKTLLRCSSGKVQRVLAL